MVPGQQSMDMIGTTYKMSSSVVEANRATSDACNSTVSKTLPSKLSEQLLGLPNQAITVPSCYYGGSYNDDDYVSGSADDSSVGMSISVITLASSMYDTDEYISDTLSLEMSSYPCSALYPESCTVDIVVPRNQDAATSLEEETISVEQEFTCAEGDYTEHSFECPGIPVPLAIQCNGTEAVVSVVCPPITSQPTCSMLLNLNSEMDGSWCKMLNYTDKSVTCRCSLLPATDIGNNDRRILESNSSFSSDGTVSVSYVSMLTAVTGSFVSTVNVAAELNANMVGKGWQAITTLGVLIVFFGSAMLFAHFADEKVKKTIAVDAKTERNTVEMRKNSIVQRSGSIFGRLVRGSSTIAQRDPHPALHARPNRYMLMAEEALPKVLMSSKSLSRRLFDEIKRHHRWIGVIYYFCKKIPRVMRIVSLATNIILMLFIQSLTYDLTKGDDGSCESFDSEATCLEPKSQYSESMSRCYWTYTVDSTNASGECHFVQPDSSFTVVIFVAIFSALVSTPIALLADWVIQNILSVPTSDSTLRSLQTATVSPIPIQPLEDKENRKRKNGLGIWQSQQLISFQKLAERDFNAMHFTLREYRASLLDESDRKEFDCKFYIDYYCVLGVIDVVFSIQWFGDSIR